MALNWETIAQKVAEGVNALAPIAETLVPEAAATIAIVNKIIQGAMAAEPTAVALVQQIQSGGVPTADQLAQFYANYQTDDDTLKADIDEHLSTLK